MITVLCYGDSNTWGYWPETDGRYPWEERYPGILNGRLGNGFRIIEDGLCGRTTCFESRLEPYVDGRKESEVCAMINAPIDIAVIMLGTNDCKDMYHAEPQVISEGIAQVASNFEKAGARIILAAPPVLQNLEESPFAHEFGKEAERKSKELAAYYRALAFEKGWDFVDTDKVVALGVFDRIHLDKEGHRKLAQSIYSIIVRKERKDEYKD